MRTLDPETDRRRGRRRDRPPRGARRRPGAVQIDSREVAVGDLFFGLRGELASTAASSPPTRSRPAPGACSSSPAPRPRLGREGHGWVLAAADPAGGAQRLARAWRRELGAAVVGITGSTGKTSVKDIAALAPAGTGPRQPGELQHRDRAAADRPLRARGHRGPGAGDGDAGSRADRRAGRDRRARRGGDHQRRAGPPRAARLGRGDRRGQGRGPRLPPGRRRRGGAGPGRRAGGRIWARRRG